MSRGVDDVDDILVPTNGRRRRSDRDAALFFEFHVIHGGAVAAAADFFNFVDPSCVKQDALSQGRLP